VDGKQFVAISASNVLYSFALPRERALISRHAAIRSESR